MEYIQFEVLTVVVMESTIFWDITQCSPLNVTNGLQEHQFTFNGLHSVISQKIVLFKYRIIFWGISSNSKKVFTLQKKIVRMMVDAKHRNSCRALFKRLEILPIPCEYILSLMNFIINNQKNVEANSAVHSANTRNKYNLHRPITNL
jgi:hypothetical protein